MNDPFFTQQKCGCGNDLNIRIMSWFTDRTICMECSDKEKDIRAKLPEHGRQHEGCGYIPEV